LAIESLNKGMSTNDPELQKNIGNHLKLDPDKPEDMKKIQKYFLTNMVYGRIVGSTGLDPEKEEDQKKIKVLMDQALIQSLQREFDDAEGEEFDKNYPDMDKVNRSEKEVSRLHDIVFNLNEEARTVDGRLVVNQASIEQYKSNIDKFLDVMSKDYNPQRVILSGHMHQEYGFDIFEGKQVRISSSEGVSEESLKSYIILDAETGYSFAMDLARNIQPLYEDAIDKELLKKINKIAKKYGGIFNSQDSEKLSNIVKVYNNASDGLKDLIELKQPEEKGKDSFGSLIDTEAYCEFETERRRYSILLSGLKMVLDSAEKKSFNSPKIRSFVINQNLIDVIEKLENHNIKINKLSTNGYSFYNVFYDIGTKKENQSENKEPTYIQIGKEGLTDVKGKNTMHYTLTSDGTFGRRIVLPVPQEVEDEQGNKGVLFRGEGFLVTDKNKQDLIEGVKEQAKYGLAQKHVVESIIDIVFKGSEIFEQPYTDKSEQEFINEILGELKDKE
ncbi:MAG: hypothetical protein L6408_06020, partial [Nanoarchaeota archaeon]|nr:hypothetical protein [Nanoarchaeota archaeon]